jgi:hypothetical protein
MEKKRKKNNAKFILIPSKEIDKLFLENYNAETNFSLSFVLFKFEGREREGERENLKGFKMAACSSERKRERVVGDWDLFLSY